jgi:phosphoribulokinase
MRERPRWEVRANGMKQLELAMITYGGGGVGRQRRRQWAAVAAAPPPLNVLPPTTPNSYHTSRRFTDTLSQ